MNISIIIESLAFGGSEKQLLLLSKNWIRKFPNSLQILVAHKSDNPNLQQEFENLGIPIHFFQSSNIILKVIKVISAIKNHKSFVVISFTFWLNWIARISGAILRIKSFGSVRSELSYYYKQNKLKFHLNTVFQLCLINHRNYSDTYLTKYLYFPNIPFSRKVFSQEHKSNIRSLSVGRCDKNKNIIKVIEIVEQFVRDGIDIHHTHIGTGQLLTELNAIVKRKGLVKYFKFIGLRSNLESFYRTNNCFIHTSLSEGNSNAVIEAILSGMIIVADKNSINRDFTLHDCLIEDLLNKSPLEIKNVILSINSNTETFSKYCIKLGMLQKDIISKSGNIKKLLNILNAT